jgi:arsenate reductase (thioredoxin)
MTTKERVLFLCTGNSCRSQLAEALVNHDLGNRWQAFSAGTQPTGEVHPLVLKVLEEVGIQHQGVSKPVDQFLGENFDLVITVCDEAAENCPVWLGKGRKVHIGFEDPAKAVGTEEEQLKVFRMTRDAIREQIVGFLR